LSKRRRRKNISRTFRSAALITPEALTCGLDSQMVKHGIEFAYNTLDLIDSKLIESGLGRLSGLVELANLSTIIGNLVAEGIVKSSRGNFTRAGAHKYQDLRSTKSDSDNVEIKVALEKNKPKAHLPKVGHYLTIRYILSDENGAPFKGKDNRGDVAWIWEVRFGHLKMRHFNVSNTVGDSGKTAVVNGKGMQALAIIYEDRELVRVVRREAR